jgi:hypothetical protein
MVMWVRRQEEGYLCGVFELSAEVREGVLGEKRDDEIRC